MVVNWFRGKVHRRKAAPPTPIRLRLDALEERVVPSTYTVTTTDDVGPGSLQEGLADAFGNQEIDTIAFDIGAGGVQTIRPTAALPPIIHPLVIDGTTQPGYAGKPLIEVSGINVSGWASGFGLRIWQGNVTVRGLVINGYKNSGLYLDAMNSLPIQLQGNYIGTDVTGSQAIGNGTGIDIANSGPVTIGGTEPGEGNVISGNKGFGISDGIAFSAQWVAQGNFIGTDATGTKALGNGYGGVEAGTGGNKGHVKIGGTAPTARNIISGNNDPGLSIYEAANTLVQGNYIGTDVTGTVALGNRRSGVEVVAGSLNTIGGTERGAGNLISGNSGDGILLRSKSNWVQGNAIGLDVSGGPLGNAGNGVNIREGMYNASNNTIGGPEDGASNRIANNSLDGVLVDTGHGNAIRANSITGHGGLGIHLINGGNFHQSFPLITSATSLGDSILIEGTLSSASNTAYALEFFANAVCNPSGFGEGERLLGSLTVTTGDDGTVPFSTTLDGTVDPGQLVAATVTDPGNNTSEFSPCVEVTEPTLPGLGAVSIIPSLLPTEVSGPAAEAPPNQLLRTVSCGVEQRSLDAPRVDQVFQTIPLEGQGSAWWRFGPDPNGGDAWAKEVLSFDGMSP